MKATHSNKDNVSWQFTCTAAGAECLDTESKEVGPELDLEIVVAIFPPSYALILISK